MVPYLYQSATPKRTKSSREGRKAPTLLVMSQLINGPSKNDKSFITGREIKENQFRIDYSTLLVRPRDKKEMNPMTFSLYI